MTHTRKAARESSQLRRDAEKIVASKPAVLEVLDARRLLHELQVHQVELEMRNEEFRQTLAELGTESKLRCEAEADRRNTMCRLHTIEENLKKKLAADLHDEMGRDLTALGLNLAIIGDSQACGTAQENKQRIIDSANLVNRLRQTTRNIMSGLRPTGLDELDLIAALEHHIDVFSHSSGITCSFDVVESFPRFIDDTEIVIFRIVQEALTNILRHSHSSHVQIVLHEESQGCLLTVSDNGRGFIVPVKPGAGMGLKIMRERTEMIGGSFRLDSIPGKGTTVSVRFGEQKIAD